MGLLDTSNRLRRSVPPRGSHPPAAEGHEIGTHTFSHKSSRHVSLEALFAAMSKRPQSHSENRRRERLTATAPTLRRSYPRSQAGDGRRHGKLPRNLGGLNGAGLDLNLFADQVMAVSTASIGHTDPGKPGQAKLAHFLQPRHPSGSVSFRLHPGTFRSSRPAGQGSGATWLPVAEESTGSAQSQKRRRQPIQQSSLVQESGLVIPMLRLQILEKPSPFAAEPGPTARREKPSQCCWSRPPHSSRWRSSVGVGMARAKTFISRKSAVGKEPAATVRMLSRPVFSTSSGNGRPLLLSGTGIGGGFNGPSMRHAHSALTFQGSGSASAPVTLLFESGAQMSAPNWGSETRHDHREQNRLHHQDRRRQQRGTDRIPPSKSDCPGYASRHQDGATLYDCFELRLREPHHREHYVHTYDLAYDQVQNIGGIYVQGGDNVALLYNNVVHDMKWCLEYSFSGVPVPSTIHPDLYNGNTAYHCDQV